ncbi:MAG: alcohol dehydrogenase catalytic domain-containing protein [Deltaproteobacteria bacterium]|nr:alcohol dehydrogenase catalytic domain-containing protein [Deltaproteobacteria bacterium]
MRAAVLEKPGRIQMKELPDPECPPGGLLVRVTHAGFCASDLKMWRVGHKDLRPPRVLGHELSGFVVESGTDLWPKEPAERVALWPGIPCCSCPACLRRQPHLCSNIQVMGFHRDGGFGELVAVPENTLSVGGVRRLPERLTSAVATLGEPLACCLNAQSKIGVGPGDRVLVFGAGVLGRLHERLARAKGATRVVLVDTDPKRADDPKSAIVADPNSEGWMDEVRNRLGGGADAVIPACSDPVALEWGFSLLDRGGRIAFFSGLGSRGSFHLPEHDRIHYQEWLVAGVYGCSPMHFHEALTLLAEGSIDVSDLLTHSVSLKEMELGFQLMEEKRSLKVILTHGGSHDTDLGD